MSVVEQDLLTIAEADEFAELDTVIARELVIDCFVDVQMHSKLRRALPVAVDAVRENVVDAAAAVMRRNGDAYDTPTSRGLIRLVAGLVHKAHGWGTPQSVLNHHTAQLGTVFDRFEELD